MKRRIARWAGIGAAVVGVLALTGAAIFYGTSERIVARQYPLPPSHFQAAHGAAAIAEGRRLVQIYGCAMCHGADLQGHFLDFAQQTSANLTRLAPHFSDADFDRAVRHGLAPDGTSLVEAMPAETLRHIPDAALADIVAYIRSRSPAGDEHPRPGRTVVDRWNLLTGKAKMDQAWFSAPPPMDLGPKYAQGRQIAMSVCAMCHGSDLTGDAGFSPNLMLVASYRESDFRHFMRTGKAMGNRELPLMSDTAREAFSHFTDPEISALYAYLSTRGQKLSR